MKQTIFRKVSVERLSSPENLDQVMRVVPVKNWIALACLFAVAAAVVAWAFLGELAIQAQGTGMVLQAGGAPGDVVAVFSTEDGPAVQAGMEASVVLAAQDNAAVTGHVAAVLATDGQTVVVNGGSIPVADILDQAAAPGDVAALIRLDDGEAARAQKVLAAVESEPAGSALGWPCRVEILVERFHPVKLILPD